MKKVSVPSHKRVHKVFPDITLLLSAHFDKNITGFM